MEKLEIKLDEEQFNKLIECFNAKKVEQVQQTFNRILTDAPKCPICGGETKQSKSGKRWICKDAKFKKENDVWTNYGCEGYVNA